MTHELPQTIKITASPDGIVNIMRTLASQIEEDTIATRKREDRAILYALIHQAFQLGLVLGCNDDDGETTRRIRQLLDVRFPEGV